ncbi:MAG TPA: hypothetical protein VMV93_11575 [Chloroflexota bacterium]|nr:hypothetical protein [Chloroflexota bacterium]
MPSRPPAAALNLNHLYRMTDNTGLYQHATGARPNPEFGYCLDDNARALTAAIRAHALTGENGLLDYIRHYLAFVERCQRPDGRFRNFMAADGTWLEALGSGDSHGRAAWGLGFAARYTAQSEVRLRALRCLDGLLPHLAEFEHPRSQAFLLLGLRLWGEAEPQSPLTEPRGRLRRALAAGLQAHATADWPWFEPELTYCNATLPHALLGEPEQDAALQALAWLCGVMEVDGVMSLIGNQGFYPRGGRRAVYDQQPVDAQATLAACLAAYSVGGDTRFQRWARLAFGWFTGANPNHLSLIDQDSGGCADGLLENDVNANQGAESLLAWLLAQEDMLEAGLSY